MEGHALEFSFLFYPGLVFLLGVPHTHSQRVSGRRGLPLRAFMAGLGGWYRSGATKGSIFFFQVRRQAREAILACGMCPRIELELGGWQCPDVSWITTLLEGTFFFCIRRSPTQRHR